MDHAEPEPSAAAAHPPVAPAAAATAASSSLLQPVSPCAASPRSGAGAAAAEMEVVAAAAAAPAPPEQQPQQGAAGLADAALQERVAWAAAMRQQFSPEGMCRPDGSIDQVRRQLGYAGCDLLLPACVHSRVINRQGLQLLAAAQSCSPLLPSPRPPPGLLPPPPHHHPPARGREVGGAAPRGSLQGTAGRLEGCSVAPAAATAGVCA